MACINQGLWRLYEITPLKWLTLIAPQAPSRIETG